MFKSIVWSDKTYTLKSFVDDFALPQLVQVESGIYSEEDAKTLSAGQILTLHVIKRTDKVLAKATGTKELFVPVNYPSKVEILPTICEDIYYSVQDVVEAISVKYIRVVHDSPPSLRLKAGDILELKRTVEENGGRFIECEFVNKSRDSVKLPLEFKAAFEPLAQPEQCHFLDLLNLHKLPVRVKFISCASTIQDASREIDLISLGSVLLKAVHQESTVICTSRADNVVTVLMVPEDLDVLVRPAEGALTGDQTYVRFCKEIHDGVDLEKINLSLANASTLYGGGDVEVLYDYVDVRPLVPTRSPGENVDSDSSDEYTEIPPPRPPKSPHMKPPLKSPKQAPQQQFFPKEKELGKQRSRDDVSDLNNDEAPPPPPVRTVSMRQPTADTGRAANKDYYNLESSSGMGEDASNQPSQTEPILDKSKAGNNDTGDSADDDDDDDFDDDDDDDDSFDEDGSDNDYLYPVWEGTPSSPPPEMLESSSQSSLKKRLSDLFKKTPPKPSNTTKPGPPSPSRETLGGCSSVTQPVPTPACNMETLSLSTSPPAASAMNPQPYFPDDLSCLSVPEVGECLEKLNLGKHVQMFDSNQIDGELFVSLNEDLLASLGVSSKFERQKIMKFINGWRPRRK